MGFKCGGLIQISGISEAMAKDFETAQAKVQRNSSLKKFKLIIYSLIVMLFQTSSQI